MYSKISIAPAKVTAPPSRMVWALFLLLCAIAAAAAVRRIVVLVVPPVIERAPRFAALDMALHYHRRPGQRTDRGPRREEAAPLPEADR
jgi:hypothetical protein